MFGAGCLFREKPSLPLKECVQFDHAQGIRGCPARAGNAHGARDPAEAQGPRPHQAIRHSGAPHCREEDDTRTGEAHPGAFQLGVNQGRVNEVIKRGKWLDDNPAAPEAIARDKAKARMAGADTRKRPERRDIRAAESPNKKRPDAKAGSQAQLLLGDL